MTEKSYKPAIVKVYDFLKANTDKPLPHAEMVRKIGVPDGTLSGVLRTIMITDPRLIKVQRGIYKYTTAEPQPTSSSDHPTLIEWIGTDSEGNGIGRSEAGRLYRIAALLQRRGSGGLALGPPLHASA